MQARSGPRSAGELRRPVVVAGLLAAVLALGWLMWPFWQFAGRFNELQADQPSRLYARPTLVVAGERLSMSRITDELRGLGYREVGGELTRPGLFQEGRGRLRVHLRSSPTPAGLRPPGLLEIRLSGSRVSGLKWRGEAVPTATLEPQIVATFFDENLEERRPVSLTAIPDHLANAVLAAEDANFFRHPGLSLSGIARAAWVNFRGGEVRQGGSTLTQQLVKNLFLSHERTLGRKIRESFLALIVELRYTKLEILNAYLNEIYWGSSGSANLIGVGSAAWAHFGKRADELGICESALLAAMIRSPGRYSPATSPERARSRRNWVLQRMAELGWLEPQALERHLAEPLGYSPHHVARRRAPYFVDLAKAEARRRFGVTNLERTGYSLLSTLEAEGQKRAEAAVGWGLGALEEGWEKGSRAKEPLQAALVSIDPRTGALLAYVGGRDYGSSQFDRASQARRQAGSAFKALVYAAAFEERVATPSGFVEDAPLTMVLAGREWSPRNSNDRYLGWVTVRSAVEQSLNVPTVRMATAAGLNSVLRLARRAGIDGPLEPLPSLALGAFEVSPVELATVYATFAGAGRRPWVHGLHGVLDRQGRPLPGAAVPEPRQVLSPQAAFLLTSVLQGVLERGTGRTARIQGMTDPLAGKTGTTNGRRDSWFAGYSPDRTTLVWVGYDDNSETRLSGARAALPIWSRFTWAVRPPGGYPLFRRPAGVVTAVVDPESGQLATGSCPRVLTEVFREGEIPGDLCRLHGVWRDDLWRGGRRVRDGETERRRWQWLRSIFGRKNRESRRPSPEEG